MKLLKPVWCLFQPGRGNVNKKTTLVEGEGIGFRTRVRLPPGPAKGIYTNPCPIPKIAVFRNTFNVVIPFLNVPVSKIPKDVVTFSMIQSYIKTTYGVEMSKSSITQVKAKCGLNELKRGHKGVLVGKVSTEKEKLVLEAFKAFELV